MIYLYISESTAFRLSFNINEIGRFSQCKLQLVRGNVVENLSEDYLYVLVEEILGRIRNIPNLENRNAIGNIGKWQEYYYFDSEYNNKHAVEIETMEKAIFFSAEKYGSFLYKYDNKTGLNLIKVSVIPIQAALSNIILIPITIAFYSAVYHMKW